MLNQVEVKSIKLIKAWKKLTEKFQQVLNVKNTQHAPGMIGRFFKTRNSLCFEQLEKAERWLFNLYLKNSLVLPCGNFGPHEN